MGFSGSQEGMTPAQLAAVRAEVYRVEPAAADHGDCIGADKQFDDIIEGVPWQVYKTLHPSNIRKKRAYCKGHSLREPLPPLERNMNIVRETGYLVATPKEPQEVLRSGTGSTIRRARKYGNPYVVIGPDGSILEGELYNNSESPCLLEL